MFFLARKKLTICPFARLMLLSMPTPATLVPLCKSNSVGRLSDPGDGDYGGGAPTNTMQGHGTRCPRRFRAIHEVQPQEPELAQPGSIRALVSFCSLLPARKMQLFFNTRIPTETDTVACFNTPSSTSLATPSPLMTSRLSEYVDRYPAFFLFFFFFPLGWIMRANR
jgi:hypothetical protein